MDDGTSKLRIFLLNFLLFCILAKHQCECQILKDLDKELELLTEKYLSLSLDREAGLLSRSKR